MRLTKDAIYPEHYTLRSSAWHNPNGLDLVGYNWYDYFTPGGQYLGPDQDCVEPEFHPYLEMDDEQTRRWDAFDTELAAKLRVLARMIMQKHPIEIYTADGIVADVVEPDHQTGAISE